MYGTTGASTYEETHANVNSSTIKTKVDTWYEENILGTEYEQYISDTLFCNDRSFGAETNEGTGVGKSVTYYRGYNVDNQSPPQLVCSNNQDKFTVNRGTQVNGALTYPIGLLTTDEAVLAGGYSTSNYNYYLYTGNWYWTMSPSFFYGSTAYVRSVDYIGNLYTDAVNRPSGVRPVINLKPNSLKLGEGTALNPYLVEPN